MPFDDDGEECDFCELTLEEGESFTDVRLGPLPQPSKIRVSETGRVKRGRRGRDAQAMLLMDTLEEHPEFEVDGSNTVVRHEPADRDAEWGVAGEYGSVPNVTQFETKEIDEMVGVGLMVFPEAVEQEPDAKLCPRCVELFK